MDTDDLKAFKEFQAFKKFQKSKLSKTTTMERVPNHPNLRKLLHPLEVFIDLNILMFSSSIH
jgi:hypothetical protein